MIKLGEPARRQNNKLEYSWNAENVHGIHNDNKSEDFSFILEPSVDFEGSE